MLYRNKLSFCTVLGIAALYLSVVLIVLSSTTLFTQERNIKNYSLSFLGLLPSVLIFISAIALFLRKHWSRILMSAGIHLFIVVYTIGCIVNSRGISVDLVTIYSLVVLPLVILLLCVHNENILNELETPNPEMTKGEKGEREREE